MARPLPQAVLTALWPARYRRPVLTADVARPLPQAVLTADVARPLPRAVLTPLSRIRFL